MKALRRLLFAGALVVFIGCQGDSSAVRAFHPNVKAGMPLTKAILEGEKAQHYDIRSRVFRRGSAEGEIEIGRYWQEPYIRITKPPPDPKRPHARHYTETGYPTREDFARGVSNTLPRFYDCKRFRFLFGRYQGGTRTDSFEVEVNSQGEIVAVSPVREDPYD